MQMSSSCWRICVLSALIAVTAGGQTNPETEHAPSRKVTFRVEHGLAMLVTLFERMWCNWLVGAPVEVSRDVESCDAVDYAPLYDDAMRISEVLDGVRCPEEC